MAGSLEELGPPDSWEMADLEESVSRLMVSPSASSSKEETAALGFVDDPSDSAGGPRDNTASSPSKDHLVAQVDQFLREALEKPRERISILRMEQDVERFIRDPTQQQLEFQALPTSYLRLAAHRVAQHYYLQSIAIPDNSMPDGSGSRIVLFKTSECRFPPIRLADISVNLPQEESSSITKVAIKQRPLKHSRANRSADSHSSKTNHPKSVEERKEEYNKARARIFSGNSSSSATQDNRPNLPDDIRDCSFTPPQEVKSVTDSLDINGGRRSCEPSTTTVSRTSRVRTERELLVNRQNPGNRVAIFRDREVDRKDPDYDRSYDRYMQRFDPGFGFTGGSYAIQSLYSPTLNYNTEFPQLSSHRAHQISVDNQTRQVVPPMCPPWSPIPPPTTLGYGTPDGMIPSYRANHVAPQSTSSMYLHSPQYIASPRPGMTFIHPHEHVPSFIQSQQQPEANFGLARPR